MDAAEQAAGEKRVNEYLIRPLKLAGLAKPASLTKAEFGEMLDDLCKKLAYMSDLNLAALAEQAAKRAGGKDKDRFPIAKNILGWAGDFQAPSDDASPLIRAVFASKLGASALDGGWAPELLRHVRANRNWPGSYVLSQIRSEANDPIRRYEVLQLAMARGQTLDDESARWRSKRAAAIARCEEISKLEGVTL